MVCAALAFGLSVVAVAAAAQQPDHVALDGLAAWDRIEPVVTHPRCTNCHVGEDGRPGWGGLGKGRGALHGMNIVAGASRIGAETLPCRTCHLSRAPVLQRPHAPPAVNDAWRLPPAALGWRGLSGSALCRKLRDPARTDGWDAAALAAHVRISAFVAWSFAPGPGRTVPPGGVTSLAQDILEWGRAGAPCRGDP